MSVTKVLLDILVVLLAAKAAAEIAERVKVPAVVGEILAGIAIGPSALGLVRGDDVLRVLGELGVILLLLDVGLEMDIGELGAVGRASLTVAAVGVVIPFAAGYGVAAGWGLTGQQALFVGAALTATSVGITARVFGDLRALASVEARTVLGAAVADDVIGLVILTVVVRIVEVGHVSVLSVLGIVAIAVGFLVITSVVGVRAAPRVFDLVARHGRSAGTLVAVALAFTLGVAELAHAAQLAPIVGAFVAGVALGRGPVAERIRLDLTPVGHLFIPVFFLQIGIDADIGQFAHANVLGLAAGLLAVAVVGKLASAAGLIGSPGDRLLVGIGMVPRGEVGLIFATLGLRQHVFGQDVYAALVLVVLATTLLPPPFLRWRLLRLRAATRASTAPAARPVGGWLRVEGDDVSGVVELVAEPYPAETLAVAFDAALLLGDRHGPGPRLLDWLSSLPDEPLRWDAAARTRFFEVLDAGTPRSWRFLVVTGLLDRALPELGQALARRQADPRELDPTGALRWPALTRLKALEERHRLRYPERLLLAAVIVDSSDAGPSAVPVARRIVQRLDLGAGAEQAVAALVEDIGLLAAAARRLDSLGEEHVLQLAVHLGSAEQVDALYLLTLATAALEPWERSRLEQLRDFVKAVLARPELTGRDASNAVEQRRSAAMRLTTDPNVRERIGAAPRAYVLSTPAADLARHAALCEPPLGQKQIRVEVTAAEAPEWRVDIAARDRVGLLARETEVFASHGLDIVEATVVTWADGCALGCFRVTSPVPPDPNGLEEELRAVLDHPLVADPVPDARVTFDNLASPWHTFCRVEAPDRPGLLHAITAAFALSGASVHSAKVTTKDGGADDLFELTDADGRKLGDAVQQAIRRTLEHGASPRRRFGWRTGRPSNNGQTLETQPSHFAAISKQTVDDHEITGA